MNNIIIVVICFIGFFFMGCGKSDKFKDDYISKRIPYLKDNLTDQELIDFKKYMEFNEDNQLIRWSMSLLRKGTKEHFDSIMTNITIANGGNIQNIVVIDTLNNETHIDTSMFKYLSMNDSTEYHVSELMSDNTLYLILSTTCGHCISEFEKLNALTNNYKGTKFIALFDEPISVIDNYKKGTMYKNFGFLNDSWIKFSNDQKIIETLLPTYNKKEGTPLIIYKDERKFIKESDLREIESILIKLN